MDSEVAEGFWTNLEQCMEAFRKHMKEVPVKLTGRTNGLNLEIFLHVRDLMRGLRDLGTYFQDSLRESHLKKEGMRKTIASLSEELELARADGVQNYTHDTASNLNCNKCRGACEARQGQAVEGSVNLSSQLENVLSTEACELQDLSRIDNKRKHATPPQWIPVDINASKPKHGDNFAERDFGLVDVTVVAQGREPGREKTDLGHQARRTKAVEPCPKEDVVLPRLEDNVSTKTLRKWGGLRQKKRGRHCERVRKLADICQTAEDKLVGIAKFQAVPAGPTHTEAENKRQPAPTVSSIGLETVHVPFHEKQRIRYVARTLCMGQQALEAKLNARSVPAMEVGLRDTDYELEEIQQALEQALEAKARPVPAMEVGLRDTDYEMEEIESQGLDEYL